MLLALDVGNTQTVIGLFDGAQLISHWRVATNADRTADEHALLVTQLLDLAGHTVEETVTGMAISSTVPSLKATLRAMAKRWFEVATMVLEPGVRSGIPILADNPREVGADRIANALSVHHLYGGPAIVVDFGTSTNFDVVSSKGEYLGGAIAPGIEISMDALLARAAALQDVELVEPRSAIGKTTVECMQSGVLYGFAGQVDGLCRRIQAELAHTEVRECTVVATGGLSSLIAPLSETIQHHEPWLTLHGLRLIFERNSVQK
ncbi:MAG: type III pantothenate kinase [Actinomycetota bacterium]|nr:type III pantothenate kinase [Actinomycetota bacterium]MDQ3679211.1 type III pantothenate kinase [Actinomycetota bacterium]